MLFLNALMLIGLAGIAIPIVIHLLHRRRAKVMDWGAMRFVLAALAARKRRIRLEEVVLLAIRCFLVGLLAVAMARPLLPSQAAVPWGLVLAALLGGSLLAALAAATWEARRARWALLAGGVALLAVAVVASGIEYFQQRERWGGGEGAQDVVIVIDGSMSMSLQVEGRSNFQRAIRGARAAVEACEPGDTVSVILAGSSPRAIVPSGISDRRAVLAALETLEPAGGSMRVIPALEAAAAALKKGSNPGKKILLITDGQTTGWSIARAQRWRFLEGMFRGEQFKLPPRIICRTLDVPESFTNAAIGEIRFARAVVGTDRAVRIDVTVTNTGDKSIVPASVELTVDGAKPLTREVGQIAPGASQTVEFDHHFQRPGRHTVEARLGRADDLPADNYGVRVLDVVRRLPVLIVDGAPSPRPRESASSFLEIALAFESASDLGGPGAVQPDADASLLVAPRVVDAADIRHVTDLSRYKVVVLANVPKLPAAAAKRIAAFVRDGGGLLLAMGAKAEPAFYNTWTGADGQAIVPVRLPPRRRATGSEPVHLALKTFTHPAMRKIAEPGKTDAGDTLIHVYWPLEAGASDPDVRVAASLATAEPFAVERKVAKGFVIMLATDLQRRDSNLHARRCFVPMVHELIYYLAAPSLPACNVVPGTEPVIELSPRGRPTRIDEPAAEIVTPTGRRERAAVLTTVPTLRVRAPRALEPGPYRLALGPELAKHYGDDSAGGRYAFVVLGDPAESSLATLSAADFETLAKRVDLRVARTDSEVVAALAGGIPGQEVWRYLALAALGALLAEIALTRWIASRRRIHTARAVEFGEEEVDIGTFRTRARQMLEPAGRQSAEPVEAS